MYNVCITSNPNLHANVVEVGHDVGSKCSKDMSSTNLRLGLHDGR
jgi:hypothetical protein